jgi:hypothetical protein
MGGIGIVAAKGHGAEVGDPDIIIAVYGRAPRATDSLQEQLFEQALLMPFFALTAVFSFAAW